MCSIRRYVLLAVPLLVLLPGCGEPLEEYISEEGKFHILLPGAPSPEAGPDLPRGISKVSLVQRSGSYTVAWEDLAASGEGTMAEQLDRACDGAVRRLQGKEQSRTSIKLAGGHPGRELIVLWPENKGITQMRLYLVDRRLYSVVISGSKWWVEKPITRRVLDSFALAE